MSQLINEIKQELYGGKTTAKKNNNINGTTLMEMVFNDQMDYNPTEMDNPGYDTSAGGPEPDTQNSGDMKLVNGQDKQEKINPLQGVDPEIKKMFNDIRVAVIRGLEKLANNPENQFYDCLKKILAIIDKPIETETKMKGNF